MLLTPGGWGGPSSPKPPSSEHTRARASVRQHSTFGLCSRGQRQKFYRRRLPVEGLTVSLGSARQGAVAQWQRACGRRVCLPRAGSIPAGPILEQTRGFRFRGASVRAARRGALGGARVRGPGSWARGALGDCDARRAGRRPLGRPRARRGAGGRPEDRFISKSTRIAK